MSRSQTSEIYLSKSLYMSGRQCPKRLWLELHRNELIIEPNIEQQFLFDEGKTVGIFAREWRGNGALIDINYKNINQAFENTQIAISNNEKRIYEAGFCKGPYRAFLDIIEKLDDGTWRAIEVKSSSTAKEVHIPDLAFQVWLMQENGLIVSEAGVVHLNNKGIWPNTKSILNYSELTEEVFEEIKTTKTLAKELIPIAQAPEIPSVAPGSQCNDPYVCQFQSICGYKETVNTFSGIPRLMQKQRNKLEAAGWYSLKEIPLDNTVLTEDQNHWLRVIKNNQTYIDSKFIKKWLEQLRYPVYSFDFETIAYRLPRYDKTSPYQQVPFQFSCHRLNQDGSIIEAGAYLHPDQSDPRLPLIKAMIASLGTEGSILAWNANFEKTIINRLLKDFPEFKTELLAINQRFLDPIEIFRKAYFHPKAMGSASIKEVGKAILSKEADYSEMEVSYGGLAFVTWHYWIHGKGSQTSEQALKDYCAKDTLIPLQLINKIQHEK